MNDLLKYELKKTFFRKPYIIAMLIMMLIMVANEMTPVILGNYMPKKEMEISLSGTVVDDAYLETLVDSGEHNTNNPIEFFVKASTGQSQVSGFTEASLYSSRKEINESLMRSDGIKDKDIAVWNKWDEKNVAPFTYYYSGAYTAFFEIAGYMNFMLLIVTGIGLSGIFAEEKTTNMDQIIFCTKNGKTKLFMVKLVVGLIMGFATFGILVATELITCIALYGFDGAQMMIQLLIPQCMLHITMGQSILIMILMLLLEELAFVVIVMAVSQLTMNKAITISAMFVVMFCGMLNIPKKLGIIYILWNAIPGAAVGSWLFDSKHLISIFGVHLNNLFYTPIIWAVGGVVLVMLTRLLYIKYQVKSR